MIEIKPSAQTDNDIQKLSDHLDEVFTLTGYMQFESEWEGEKRVSTLLFTPKGTYKTYSAYVNRCLRVIGEHAGETASLTQKGNTKVTLDNPREIMVTSVDVGHGRQAYKVYMA